MVLGACDDGILHFRVLLQGDTARTRKPGEKLKNVFRSHSVSSSSDFSVQNLKLGTTIQNPKLANVSCNLKLATSVQIRPLGSKIQTWLLEQSIVAIIY